MEVKRRVIEHNSRESIPYLPAPQIKNVGLINQVDLFRNRVNEQGEGGTREEEKTKNVIREGPSEYKYSLRGGFSDLYFYLTYGMSPLMSINWLDYPGNLITGSDGNWDSEQYVQFQEALLEADLVILCIPVMELMTVELFNNTVLQAYYNLITEALSMEEEEDNRFSIGFMVTKADEYGNKAEMTDRLMKLIEVSPFCKAKSDHWNVFGFYTTLGKHLRFISSEDGKETKRIDPATYDPEGFEMPVFLAAISSVSDKKRRVESQISRLEREISVNQKVIAEKKRTVMYNLFHYGRNVIISKQEAIDELNKQIRTFDDDYKKNKERFDRMMKILDDAGPLAYKNGARYAIRDIYD